MVDAVQRSACRDESSPVLPPDRLCDVGATTSSPGRSPETGAAAAAAGCEEGEEGVEGGCEEGQSGGDEGVVVFVYVSELWGQVSALSASEDASCESSSDQAV